MVIFWMFFVIFCLGILMLAGLLFGALKSLGQLLGKFWDWLFK